MKRIWIPLFLIAVAGSANAQDRPNVVVMLADNVGYGDIGVYGAGEIRGIPAPRIDQLASEGLRLTQFLVEPGCTPSRAAIMTGRYPQRAGLSTIIVGGTPNTLQAGEETLVNYSGAGVTPRPLPVSGTSGRASRACRLARASTSIMWASSKPQTAPCIAMPCSAPDCPRRPSPRPSLPSGNPNRTET